MWFDWLLSLRLVGHDHILGALFAIAGVVMFGQGIVNVLWVVSVKDVLGEGEMEYGWVQVAVAAEALSGGPILAWVSHKLSPSRLIETSGVLVVLLLLAMFSLPWLPVTLPLQFLVGISAVGFSVTQRTLLQTRTEDCYLARVLGALDTIGTLLMLNGQSLADALGDRVGSCPCSTWLVFSIC